MFSGLAEKKAYYLDRGSIKFSKHESYFKVKQILSQVSLHCTVIYQHALNIKIISYVIGLIVS